MMRFGHFLRNAMLIYCVHVVINKASWSSAFLRITPSTSSIILSSWSASKNKRNSTFSRIQVPFAFARQKSDELGSRSSTSSNTDIDSVILSELNANQRNAVTSPTTGITRVVAGPGAGKENTYFLLTRCSKKYHLSNLF